MVITVVGLGVIGGSFIKSLKGLGHEVYGVDLDQATLDKAKAEGYIVEGFKDGREIIKKTDLTIICLYPSLVLDFIKNHRFKPGSIINDATGIKAYFLDEAYKIIPDDVELISGHPMAGREKKGYDYASKEVFKNANYILIDQNNDLTKMQLMENFVASLGFKSVKIMSAQEHDEIIAFTSQLPHVIAVALINSDNQKYDTGKYIGDSYRDLTRIAAINEVLWSELFMNNKENLLQKITVFEQEIAKIKQAVLAGDQEKLISYFQESTKRRENL